jgi:hypothetical protein
MYFDQMEPAYTATVEFLKPNEPLARIDNRHRLFRTGTGPQPGLYVPVADAHLASNPAMISGLPPTPDGDIAAVNF